MTGEEIRDRWLAAFGKTVPEDIMKDHVRAYGNYLWHIFTWGSAPCLEKTEARRAFDELDYTSAIRFYGGRSNTIQLVSRVGKLSSEELSREEGVDVYIVAEDFSWTYVKTHEDMFGPYFCMK